MDEQAEIRALQQEVARMEGEMIQQYHLLQQLQQRLNRLSPAEAPVPARRQPNVAPRRSIEQLIGLRLIHVVGIVVLVIGVSIGVKYAFDRNLISELARIVLAYAAGAALLFTSWRLRGQYPAFSAILFSGAMATLYFTSYAAHVYYGLIPFAAVFGFMVLLTVFTAFEAMRYNRAEIALLGLVGAYGIPFLISRNAERADLLFLYIGLINCGVLFLRFKKEWPVVARTAQLLTWALFIGWASTRYRAEELLSATVYLSFFFLLFSAMVLAPLLRRASGTQAAHFQLLNNGAFFLSALFIFAPAHTDTGVAAVALGCALLAGAQAFAFRSLPGAGTYLVQTHLLLSITFLVIALAWRMEGLAVTCSWLLVAVGLFAAGMALREKWWRLAALGLMALTLVKLLLLDSQRFSAGQKVIAYLLLGVLLLVVSFFYQKFRQKWFEE